MIASLRGGVVGGGDCRIQRHREAEVGERRGITRHRLHTSGEEVKGLPPVCTGRRREVLEGEGEGRQSREIKGKRRLKQ